MVDTVPEEGLEFTRDQHGCARCYGDLHEALVYHPFTHPVVVLEGEFTHWAMCPVLDEPILLLTTPVQGGPE